MSKEYYPERVSTNPYPDGLPLTDIINSFVRVFKGLGDDGYFAEAFGFQRDYFNYVNGSIENIEETILFTTGRKNLWPISDHASDYSEDDFFEIVKFLHQYISKPIEGTINQDGERAEDWTTFNKQDGQNIFRKKINPILDHYVKKFELAENGKVFHKTEKGFELLLNADVPSEDEKIVNRIDAAVIKFRSRDSSIDDRRQVILELVGILEHLRPKIKVLLTKKDEKDIFNIANNFGIRHQNDKQKTSYDEAIWFSWMFYFYLSTIHVVLRKINQDKTET